MVSQGRSGEACGQGIGFPEEVDQLFSFELAYDVRAFTRGTVVVPCRLSPDGVGRTYVPS